MNSHLSMASASCLALWCLASSLPCQASKPTAGRPLTIEQDFATWCEWLRPDTRESAWATTIPWLPSFAEGIHRANEQEKPLLLWVMNGHPLGCT
jgi:hypothetical protein